MFILRAVFSGWNLIALAGKGAGFWLMLQVLWRDSDFSLEKVYMDPQQDNDTNYLTAFRGSFTSALKWHNLDALWETVRQQASDDWYIYAIGHEPPETPVAHDKLNEFITEIDELLRKEHDHDRRKT